MRPIVMREVGKRKWDEASQGLDYSKDVPKPVQARKEQKGRDFNPNWNASTAWLGQLMQVLAIVLAVLGIGYGIFRTMQAPRNRRIGKSQDGTIITMENVDAYIHENDL